MGKKIGVIDENTSMRTLAGPLFVEMLLMILLNNVDTVMLSRYSENAVGAVGNANQVMSLFLILFTIIAGATGVVVSQYLGAGQKSKMNQIYTLSVMFNLFWGIGLSVFLVCSRTGLLKLMNVTDNMIQDSSDYMLIVGGCLFFHACYGVLTQILRCNGYTKIGMYISLLVNVVNITGNYLFLYGPLKGLEMGVRGVAISTVVSRFLAVCIALTAFRYLKIGKIALRTLRPFPRNMLWKMLKIGVPSAGENLAYSIYQLVLLSFVNIMGDNAVNAKVYATTLMSFSVVFSNSVAQATQIVTGHLVGAGKEEAASRRVWKSLRLCVPVAVAIATLNCLLCPLTLRIFTDNTEVISLVQHILIVGILMEIGRTTNLTIISSMKAAGDYLFPVLAGLFCMWFVGVGVGYFNGVIMGLGVTGIFTGIAADECFRGFIVALRWKKGKWRNRSLIER